MTAKQINATLQGLADPAIAEHSQRFFKTGKGEYGEGDVFLGIRVPVLRNQVRHFKSTPLPEVIKALHSKYHEQRLFALLLLVHQYAKGDETVKTNIYNTYLENTNYINNWDLVDSSAHQIVGSHLQNKNRQMLVKLVKSKSLWERRIAMIATYHYIKRNDFDDALAIAELLLNDQQDLIHKAAGWMLREIGKRDAQTEKAFLKQHYQRMPRTMLRYAIEKFPKAERALYLNGEI